jgi:hypothetical protein
MAVTDVLLSRRVHCGHAAVTFLNVHVSMVLAGEKNGHISPQQSSGVRLHAALQRRLRASMSNGPTMQESLPEAA